MEKILNSPWERSTHPIVAIVEDSDEDFYAFLRTIEKIDYWMRSPYCFLRLQDGDEVLDYLLRQGEYEELDAPLPATILLDLNLPGTDGRQVLREVKQNPDLKKIPIVVLTTSNNPRDIDSCYNYGTNSYLLKPMGASALKQTVSTLCKYWFDLSLLPSYA